MNAKEQGYNGAKASQKQDNSMTIILESKKERISILWQSGS